MYHGPLRITTPPTRINDDLILNAHFFDIKLKYQHLFLEKNYKHQIIDGDSNDSNTRFDAAFLKKTFVYVITETVSEYPYPYFSEKTWKAMLNKVPFMIVGSQYSLQRLQSFGFKTFSNWWDETYDSLPTAAERIEAMVIELKKLSELDYSNLLDIRLKIESTVNYNFNQIKSFKDKDLDNIKNKI
jgi:hypothetical protein